MATTFYSRRLALYLYLTLPLITIASSPLDRTTIPRVNPRRS
jgi:hypothetical protein